MRGEHGNRTSSLWILSRNDRSRDSRGTGEAQSQYITARYSQQWGTRQDEEIALPHRGYVSLPSWLYEPAELCAGEGTRQRNEGRDREEGSEWMRASEQTCVNRFFRPPSFSSTFLKTRMNFFFSKTEFMHCNKCCKKHEPVISVE